MIEKVSRLAEHAATSASRRDFLGILGRGALSLAAVASGLLALPRQAEAQFGPVCCWYWEVTNNYSPGVYTKCGKNGYYSCPKPRKGYVLYGAQSVASCQQCR